MSVEFGFTDTGVGASLNPRGQECWKMGQGGYLITGGGLTLRELVQFRG